MTNNFYAILEDKTVKAINLTQPIIPDVQNIFVTSGQQMIGAGMEYIRFTGNYKIEEDEVLFVEMALPEAVTEVSTNATGIETLDLDKDGAKIRALFWYEEGIYYFQNFDNRKLLRNRNVIIYSSNTYSRLQQNAFIIDPAVNAVYAAGNFFFTSYANANKLFSLSEFYHAATDDEIRAFAISGKVALDQVWFTAKTNSVIRKNITLLQQSNILATADTKKIKRHAAKFKLTIDLDADGKIVFPNDHRASKDILTFLNEQFFRGVITGRPYRTNSKRDA